jgi:hypothetical protein
MEYLGGIFFVMLALFPIILIIISIIEENIKYDDEE